MRRILLHPDTKMSRMEKQDMQLMPVTRTILLMCMYKAAKENSSCELSHMSIIMIFFGHLSLGDA